MAYQYIGYFANILRVADHAECCANGHIGPRRRAGQGPDANTADIEICPKPFLAMLKNNQDPAPPQTVALPMAGIRVLDLTQIYNGPYATFLMAMAGAEVIKVEPPGGDNLRGRDPEGDGGIPFAMLNRNKKSLRLNLKSNEGRKIFLELLRVADVVVENFSPGVIDRLGLGYDTLRSVKPDIILASGSGYGQSGTYRNYPAMDLTVQAMSGVMSTTGLPHMPPIKAGPAVADFGGGVHLFGAIATALLARERFGTGAWIDVAMLDAVYPTLASSLGQVLSSPGYRSERTGNRHGGMTLCPYNVYPARDGFVAIICNNDQHWKNLLLAMERSDLVDSGYLKTNGERIRCMDEVDEFVSRWTRITGRDDIVDRLVKLHVPSAAVRELHEVVRDRHLHDRGMLFDVEDEAHGNLVLCNSPINIVGMQQPAYEPFPKCGEHTDEILASLKMSQADVVRLRSQGIV
jgi:formyl-CoA transferase